MFYNNIYASISQRSQRINLKAGNGKGNKRAHIFIRTPIVYNIELLY